MNAEDILVLSKKLLLSVAYLQTLSIEQCKHLTVLCDATIPDIEIGGDRVLSLFGKK
jgi:hypothetical protein